MKKLLLPFVFAVLGLSLIGFQDVYAQVTTIITDQSSCENAPVLGAFSSGTCVLTGARTVPELDNWRFQIASEITGKVDVFGAFQIRSDSSNSGTINVINSNTNNGRGVLELSLSADFTNQCDGVINLVGEGVGAGGTIVILGAANLSPIVNNFGTITGTDSDIPGANAIVRLLAGPDVPVFNNHGILTVPVANSGGIFNDNLPNQCLIGGTLLPIDTTSLLLAGAQMNAVWMIPVIVSAIGIGIIISRKF